jgi:hypothetical protein
VAGPDQIQAGKPGYDHCRIGDRLQQPTFHHLEGFGLL